MIAQLLVAMLAVVVLASPSPAGHPSSPGPPVRITSPDADAVVAEVRRGTARYRDIAAARAAGFVQITGMERRHGYHFMRPGLGALTGAVNLADPPVLLYVERDGVWRLVGVEYMAREIPASGPIPRAAWGWHEASCHYRDWTELPAVRASDCPARHPASQAPLVLWHPAAAVAHVWAWHDNPDGAFAHENRALDPYGGTTSHGTHRHGPNATEVAYSELNHRVAGGFLLVIAIGTAIGVGAPLLGAARWLVAGLWVLFGAYIFVTADPEAWPLGGGTFADVFGDALVLQHKLLSLIPVALGVAEAVRAAGARPGFVWVAPVMAMLGGLGLFFHDHDGGLHFDRQFVQHAAMGGAGIVAGAALLLVGRRAAWSARVRWAWPALLGATALVLLFYSE